MPWNKSETTTDTWRAECGLTLENNQYYPGLVDRLEAAVDRAKRVKWLPLSFPQREQIVSAAVIPKGIHAALSSSIPKRKMNNLRAACPAATWGGEARPPSPPGLAMPGRGGPPELTPSNAMRRTASGALSFRLIVIRRKEERKAERRLCARRQ